MIIFGNKEPRRKQRGISEGKLKLTLKPPQAAGNYTQEIKWRHAEPLHALADKLVPVRTSPEIVGLALRHDAALIDSEDDLTAVAFASLERLEGRMRSHPIEWRALWNEDDHRPVKDQQHPSGNFFPALTGLGASFSPAEIAAKVCPEIRIEPSSRQVIRNSALVVPES